MLSACGGNPETGFAPPSEPLESQELALCSGASVSTLTLSNLSSYGGEVIGMGSWQVSYPANAVSLEYYIDGVRYDYGDHMPDDPINRTGSWHFSHQGIACGPHTFEVRAWPLVLSSTGREVCGPSASKNLSYAFSEACPTGALSCARSSTTSITCTGSGSGGTGGPYTALWKFVKDRPRPYVSNWSSGSLSRTFSCPQKTSIQYPYNGTLTVSFMARDASGLVSALLSKSFICVF
jgi:hypothetical protein